MRARVAPATSTGINSTSRKHSRLLKRTNSYKNSNVVCYKIRNVMLLPRRVVVCSERAQEFLG